MMPMYMNSSKPGEVRGQGHYYQGFGNHPHHMTMDASSPVSCEHWPAPLPYYGSCIHGNFPAFNAYWPPCYPPQVPYHPCCTNYSGFNPHATHAPPCYVHQPFPAGYQPCYDSEKDVPGKHRCTKCSPHVCYPKTDRSIVIEEHEPEIEKGHNWEALKHVRSPNCPYPIVWNQEHGSSTGSGSHDQLPGEVKVPENTKVDVTSWNGCFPFNENTIKSLLQNQDRKKLQNGKTVELPFDISQLKSLFQGQEGKELRIPKKNKEPGQFPSPIVWIPSHGKQEEVEAPVNRKECNSKSLPHLNGGQIAQQKGEEGNIECKVLSDGDEKSSMRNIPVESHLQEPRCIPVKLLENHMAKPTDPTKIIAKTEQKKKKEQTSSPPKASRLPPVCLRVDPLPKRKNSGSKSLSPSRRKEQPLTSEDTEVASQLGSKKAETRTIAEACDVKSEEPNKEKKASEERLNATGTEIETVESNYDLQGGANYEIVRPCETKENREKPAKKTFTDEEAARVIQSGYRGFDVRRWEPLKKLKEIATVREQMGDVKKRVQELEVLTDKYSEEKEIVILGEMVMSLLLKLDSVQGLHPNIRDYRKSLAKELSDIQEKLDSMKLSSAFAEKEAVKEQVEISSHISDSPLNLERTQPTEENNMASNSNTENVLVLPSSEEHSMSLMNIAEEQLAKAEEGSELIVTSATDPEPITETGSCDAVASLTTISEKREEVESVLPINPLSADGNGMTVTNGEENNAMVESLEEPLQVVETTEGPENATGVSEAEASATENVDRKGDVDTLTPSEKEVELSELPVVVELLSQDSSSCTRDIDQETSEAHEEKEEAREETQGIESEIPEETKKLMEENKRFKETMETLVKAGREQLQVISKLTGRVKSLEKKLSQKKKKRKQDLRRGKHVTIPNVRKFD